MQINTTLLTEDEKRLFFRLQYLKKEQKPHDFKNELLNKFERSHKAAIKENAIDWLWWIEEQQEERANRILTLCHTGR